MDVLLNRSMWTISSERGVQAIGAWLAVTGGRQMSLAVAPHPTPTTRGNMGPGASRVAGRRGSRLQRVQVQDTPLLLMSYNIYILHSNWTIIF